VENLIGTPWADTLTGDERKHVLDGGAGGADVLNGGAGNDTLNRPWRQQCVERRGR